jgi:hypothetical protein
MAHNKINVFLSGWPDAMRWKSFVDAYKEHMFYIGYNLSTAVHLSNFGQQTPGFGSEFYDSGWIRNPTRNSEKSKAFFM